MEDYKKVDASVSIEAYCHCPYCNAFEDVFYSIRDQLDEYHSAENCDKEVTCSECGKVFIIDNVNF